MKVLIIPSWYYSDKLKISGIFFKEQAEALVKEGVDVTVACYEPRKITHIFDDKKNKKELGYIFKNINGVKEHRVIKYNIPPRVPMVVEFNFFKAIDKIISILIKDGKKPDIIHLHSTMPGGYAISKIWKKYKIPYVITEHSTGFTGNILKKYEESYIREAFLYSKKIIAVGNELANKMLTYTNKKIEIIPNMVDTSRFNISQKSSQAEVENRIKKFKFLSVGRLVPNKGFDILIEAFVKSFNNNDSIILEIGGDGEERSNILNLIKKHGAENTIKILGELNRDEVFKKMEECDVFVLGSRVETFGVVFIEALSCGKPIIAPDLCGPKSIVNKYNGLIFKTENIDDLSKKLKDIKENYEKYNSILISRECREKYSEKKICHSLIEIYNDVINTEKKC